MAKTPRRLRTRQANNKPKTPEAEENYYKHTVKKKK